MPIPAAPTMTKLVNRASRAAPRAGTTASAMVLGSSWVSGATKMPRPPAMTQAMTVFASARRLADSPDSAASVSLSCAARVASPKRV